MFKTAIEYTNEIEALTNSFKEVWGNNPTGGPERTAWDDACEKFVEEEIPDVLPQEFWDRLTEDQRCLFINIGYFLFGSFPDHALRDLQCLIEDVLGYGKDFPLIHAIAENIWPHDCEEWYPEVASMLAYIRSLGYTITKENK